MYNKNTIKGLALFIHYMRKSLDSINNVDKSDWDNFSYTEDMIKMTSHAIKESYSTMECFTGYHKKQFEKYSFYGVGEYENKNY